MLPAVHPATANFDGKGPAAPGFNPPPANFTDPTTIAMLQESYLFWRIKKGGVGLPIEGMPWKSAMPRWELELSDEEIWKIIMGEYDGAASKATDMGMRWKPNSCTPSRDLLSN